VRCHEILLRNCRLVDHPGRRKAASAALGPRKGGLGSKRICWEAAAQAAVGDAALPRRLQHGIDEFGAGLDLVHDTTSQGRNMIINEGNSCPGPAEQAMKIKAVVHEAEEGGFWAEVPAIPGCATQGETMEELLRNLHDAIEGCLSIDVAEPKPGGKQRILEIAV